MKRCLFPVVACLAGIAFAEVDPSSVDSSGHLTAAAANPSISVRTSAAFTGTGLLLANGEYHGTAILLR